MKLPFKILFFLLAIFQTDISEAKVIVFGNSVSEIKFTVDNVESKNDSKLIFKNDFGISCKGESNLLVYRNLAKYYEVLAHKM